MFPKLLASLLKLISWLDSHTPMLPQPDSSSCLPKRRSSTGGRALLWATAQRCSQPTQALPAHHWVARALACSDSPVWELWTRWHLAALPPLSPSTHHLFRSSGRLFWGLIMYFFRLLDVLTFFLRGHQRVTDPLLPVGPKPHRTVLVMVWHCH